MIYAPERFLFIHIPRTSGTAIKRAFMRQALRSDLWENVLLNMTNKPFSLRRHVTLSELADAEFAIDRQPVITVVRNPFDIIGSCWRLVCRDHADRRRFKAESWREFCNHFFAAGFEQFVLEHFAYLQGRGGFFGHFCEVDGKSPVQVFQFEMLNRDWPQLAKILQMSGERPLGNSAVGCGKENWTEALIKHVAELCRGDLERFGYQIPCGGACDNESTAT